MTFNRLAIFGFLLLITSQTKAGFLYPGTLSEAIDQAHLIFIGEVERLQSPPPSQWIDSALSRYKNSPIYFPFEFKADLFNDEQEYFTFDNQAYPGFITLMEGLVYKLYDGKPYYQPFYSTINIHKSKPYFDGKSFSKETKEYIRNPEKDLHYSEDNFIRFSTEQPFIPNVIGYPLTTANEAVDEIRQLIELKESEASYRTGELVKSLSVADLKSIYPEQDFDQFYSHKHCGQWVKEEESESE